MTLPLTSRERRLLARDESHGRGDQQAVSNVTAPAAAYDDDQLTLDQEDSGLETLNAPDKIRFCEDLLLPGYIPPCVVGLPSLLRQPFPPRDQLRLALLPEELRSEMESRGKLLSQIVLQEENKYVSFVFISMFVTTAWRCSDICFCICAFQMFTGGCCLHQSHVF
jgi:hypothetical protein